MRSLYDCLLICDNSLLKDIFVMDSIELSFETIVGKISENVLKIEFLEAFAFGLQIHNSSHSLALMERDFN